MSENFTQFARRWREKCIEIKKQSLTRRQCFYIRRNWTSEMKFMLMLESGKEKRAHAKDYQDEVTDVDLALEIANSKYRKAGGWWVKVLKSIKISKPW